MMQETVRYYLLDGFPVRVRESPDDASAEWLNRDGTTTPADHYKAVVDGHLVPAEVAMMFWGKYDCGGRAAGSDSVMMQTPFPSTIDEAVERLLSDLSPAQRDALCALSRAELISAHFDLGVFVRNKYGLHRQDCPIVSGKGQFWNHPDSVSAEIIQRAWARLQSNRDQ